MLNGSVVLAKATTTSSYADVALFTDAPSHPAPSRDSSTVLVYTIPPAGAASALPPGIRRPRREDERSAFDAGAPSSASDDWRTGRSDWEKGRLQTWYRFEPKSRLRTFQGIVTHHAVVAPLHTSRRGTSAGGTPRANAPRGEAVPRLRRRLVAPREANQAPSDRSCSLGTLREFVAHPARFRVHVDGRGGRPRADGA
jgi:hypothetical protein